MRELDQGTLGKVRETLGSKTKSRRQLVSASRLHRVSGMRRARAEAGYFEEEKGTNVFKECVFVVGLGRINYAEGLIQERKLIQICLSISRM